MRSTNHYDLLEIDEDATVDEIRAAWRRLACQHHPDRNPGCPVSDATMRALNEARDVLCDPEARAAYDRRLRAPARRKKVSPDWQRRTVERTSTGPLAWRSGQHSKARNNDPTTSNGRLVMGNGGSKKKKRVERAAPPPMLTLDDLA